MAFRDTFIWDFKFVLGGYYFEGLPAEASKKKSLSWIMHSMLHPHETSYLLTYIHNYVFLQNLGVEWGRNLSATPPPSLWNPGLSECREGEILHNDHLYSWTHDACDRPMQGNPYSDTSTLLSPPPPPLSHTNYGHRVVQEGNLKKEPCQACVIIIGSGMVDVAPTHPLTREMGERGNTQNDRREVHGHACTGVKPGEHPEMTSLMKLVYNYH